MKPFWNIDLGDVPGVLGFSGADAVRFLNGQVTQDVRLLEASEYVLPSCVTDAKGKLQHRVWLSSGKSVGEILVLCRLEDASSLESRLTRYLIADEVEVRDLSRQFSISDFGGVSISEYERISHCLPKWGLELREGILPPEAGLDATDISYNKGCYIGQEVISRIKSAGKLNRRLTRFSCASEVSLGLIHDLNGLECGEVTSYVEDLALGYLKKGYENHVNFLSGTVEINKF